MEDITPSFRSVISVPVEPPTDIFKIDELPLDLQKKAVLGLDYYSIINLCKSRKKLANICRDSYFWKAKLIRDYPEINVERLNGQEFRAKYELRLANKLNNKANDILMESESGNKISFALLFNLLANLSSYFALNSCPFNLSTLISG